jgi:hypothetical protein
MDVRRIPVRPLDQARARRVVIAVLTDDWPMLEAVIDELRDDDDPLGVIRMFKLSGATMGARPINENGGAIDAAIADTREYLAMYTMRPVVGELHDRRILSS